MGCAGSIDDSMVPIRIPSKIGLLKIVVIDGFIEHQTTKVFSMDPYVKLRISNQEYQTNYIYNGGAQPKFNETFQFVINSCYKKFGRKLEVQMWDRNKISDSQIGYGLLDLDPIISGKMPTKDLRVFLNYQRQEAGIVNIRTQFTEMPYETISFRFQLASLRNKIRKFGDMNCCVKVTFGQQQLNTKYVIDSKMLGPRWPQDILTFYIPKFVEKGKIQVYDEHVLVGALQILVEQLLSGQERQLYNQELFLSEGGTEKILAGNLKFQVIRGSTATFENLTSQTFNSALKQSILKSAMKVPLEFNEKTPSPRKVVRSARVPGMDSTDNLILQLKQQEQWTKLQRQRLIKQQKNLQKQQQALRSKLLEAQQMKVLKSQKKKLQQLRKKEQQELRLRKMQQQRKKKQEQRKRIQQEEKKKKEIQEKRKKEQEQKRKQEQEKKKQQQEKQKKQEEQKRKQKQEQQKKKKQQEEQNRKKKQQQQKKKQEEEQLKKKKQQEEQQKRKQQQKKKQQDQDKKRQEQQQKRKQMEEQQKRKREEQQRKREEQQRKREEQQRKREEQQRKIKQAEEQQRSNDNAQQRQRNIDQNNQQVKLDDTNQKAKNNPQQGQA